MTPQTDRQTESPLLIRASAVPAGTAVARKNVAQGVYFHADIRKDSMVWMPKTTMGWSEPAMYGNFICHILRTFRVKANVIMHRHEVPYRFSSGPKNLFSLLV